MVYNEDHKNPHYCNIMNGSLIFLLDDMMFSWQ